MVPILYYSPGACSLAAHIVLRELGEPFTLIRVEIAKGEHNQPTYLKINPRGRIPTLMIENVAIRELSGILTWLGQRHEKLYPKAGTNDAARCGEWLAWLTSTLHISFAMVWRGIRFAPYDHQHIALRRMGLRLLNRQFQEIEDALVGQRYLVGGVYTVADPNLFVFYRWGWRMGFDMRARFPFWGKHTDLMLARPAVIEAIRVENIPVLPTGPDPLIDAMPPGEVTTDQLKSFDAAWAHHDIEALLSMMDDGAAYCSATGPDPGATFYGKDEIRRGIARALQLEAEGMRDVRVSWIAGDVGFALWSIEPEAESGSPKVNGMDFFEFKGGKILKMDSFQKTAQKNSAE